MSASKGFDWEYPYFDNLCKECCGCQHLIQCVYLITEFSNNGTGQEAALASRMASILLIRGLYFLLGLTHNWNLDLFESIAQNNNIKKRREGIPEGQVFNFSEILLPKFLLHLISPAAGYVPDLPAHGVMIIWRSKIKSSINLVGMEFGFNFHHIITSHASYINELTL